jgi:hypothetical protein
LIQKAIDNEIKMMRLNVVANEPLRAFGAFSETYIGATTEQRPVAIPAMTRPAYKHPDTISTLVAASIEGNYPG